MLKNLIKKAANGDKDSMQKLIKKFAPLLRKYSRKLNYEDAYQDFVLFFLELIPTLAAKSISDLSEPTMISYIETSIKHHYIFLSKKHSRVKSEIIFSQLSEEQQSVISNLLFTEDVTFSFLENYSSFLTETELKILYYIYDCGYSAAYIGRKLHISRQAVNQMKLRALKKIRKVL